MSEVCRYCGSSQGELIHPCKCDGSIASAHPRCLAEWVSSSGSFRCEICSRYYNVSKIVLNDTSYFANLSDFSILWKALVARVEKSAETIHEFLFMYTVFCANGIVCVFLYILLLGQFLDIGTAKLLSAMTEFENRTTLFVLLMVNCLPIQLISLIVMTGVHAWQEWVFIHEAEVSLPPLQEQGDVARETQGLTTTSLDEAMGEEENKYIPMGFLAQYDKEDRRNLCTVKADTALEGEALLKCIKKVLNDNTPVSFFERKLPRIAIHYGKRFFYAHLWTILVLLSFKKINGLVFSLNRKLFDVLSRTSLGYHMASVIAHAGLEDIAFSLRHALTVMPSLDDAFDVNMNFLFFLNYPILFGSAVLKLMPSNRWKRNWAVIYVLIRGLIVGFSLVFLGFMFMRIPGSLLESKFYVNKNAITGLMDTSTAWQVLQKNGLAPLVCNSTESKMTNSFVVLKALYTVSHDFIPFKAETLNTVQSDVCLNTFDAASCGSFLFHDRGYIHYAAYSVRVLWRILTNRVVEEVTNNLLFSVIPILAVLNLDIVKNRTKLGGSLSEGIFFLLAHLDIRTAFRIFFEFSMVLMLAFTVVSWASWTLLKYLDPGSFPIVMGYFSQDLFLIIKIWSKCPNVFRTLMVWSKLSDFLQRAYGVSAAAMDTDRRLTLSDFVAYVSYITTYFAVTVVLTSLIRYIQLSSNLLWLFYIPLFDLFFTLSQLLNWRHVIKLLVDRARRHAFLFFSKLWLRGLYGLQVRVDGDFLVLKRSISVPSVFKPQIIETQQQKLIALYEDHPHTSSRIFWKILLDGREVSLHYSRIHEHGPLFYHGFSAKRLRVMYGSCVLHFIFWFVVPFIAGRGLYFETLAIFIRIHPSVCFLVPWLYNCLCTWLMGVLLLLIWFIIEGGIMESPFVNHLVDFLPHCLFYWHVDTVHYIAIPILIRCISINLGMHICHASSVSTSKTGSGFVFASFTPLITVWVMMQVIRIKRIWGRRRDQADAAPNGNLQTLTIQERGFVRPSPVVLNTFEALINQGVEEVLPDGVEAAVPSSSSPTSIGERFRHFFIDGIMLVMRKVGTYLRASWVELVNRSRLYLYTARNEGDTIGVVFQDYEDTS
ncbi:unnamed protein product [Phytomonas sp. EM1]|nr:unnamed protein product [Phytomonas sp. EM1]|eukprot:CCW60269.1 unnamed protein product [Phytomonas sp. isolate EM1]